MKQQCEFRLETWAEENRCVPGEAVAFSVRAQHQSEHSAALLVNFELAGPREDVFSSGHGSWVYFALGAKRQQTDIRFADHWREDRFHRAGSIFLVPPGECLHLRSPGGAQSSIICRLPPELPPERTSQRPLRDDAKLEAILDVHDANVHQLLLRLANEMRSPGFAGDLLIELMISQLLIEIGGYWTSTIQQTGGGLSPWQLRRLDDRLNATGSPPTLSELATLCDVSPRHLTRGFRVSRGCSIGAVVKERQFDRANALLRTTRPIKEIAGLLGFRSTSAFIHAYAKYAGVTPHQFRLQRLGAAG